MKFLKERYSLIGTLLRLLLALIVGILCGLLLSTLYTQGSHSLTVVLFILPLIMGIAAPFVVGWQSRHILLRSLFTGFVAWLSMSGFLLMRAYQQEVAYAAFCQLPDAASECARSEGWLTGFTTFYLEGALILMVLSAVITSVIVMRSR